MGRIGGAMAYHREVDRPPLGMAVVKRHSRGGALKAFFWHGCQERFGTGVAAGAGDGATRIADSDANANMDTSKNRFLHFLM